MAPLMLNGLFRYPWANSSGENSDHRSKCGGFRGGSQPFRDLPTNPVRYPESWRYRWIVESWSSRYGFWLSSTPWLCAYRPVRTDPRDGQQSGVVTNALGNVTPVRRSHRRVFFSAFMVSPGRWSSVTISRMLGRGSAWPPALGAGPAATGITTPATTPIRGRPPGRRIT